MPTVNIDVNDEGSTENQIQGGINNATDWTNSIRNGTTAQNPSSSSTGVNNPTSATNGFVNVFFSSGRGGGTGLAKRIYMFFNNFGTDVTNGTITGLTLNLNTNTSNAQSNAISVAKSAATGMESGDLVVGDYDAVDFNTLYGPSGGSTSSGNTYSIDLNSDAISDANTNGFLRICILHRKFDMNDSGVFSGLSETAQIRLADSSLVNQLAITYDAATGYSQNVSGVASANIAKINGVATANIAKISGVS